MLLPAAGGSSQPLRQLYSRIAEAYGSGSHDAEADIATSLVTLRLALGKGVTEELMVAQATAAGMVAGDYKTKASSLIASKFWERTYEVHVVGQRYSPPGPHPYDPTANEPAKLNPYPAYLRDADMRQGLFAQRPADEPASAAAIQQEKELRNPPPAPSRRAKKTG